MIERQIHLSSGGWAALQGYDGLLRFGKELSRMFHGEMPCFVQLDFVLAAREKRHTEILLQMLHRARDGGRGDMKFFGDLTQCTEIGEGCKLFQFIKVNHAAPLIHFIF